ncbi:MAG TPA: pyridoxal phosphate-dependent aminotransferase [Candidatus Acidoferrales bacterium]|nr:pyridoxal phosphate-dependent aminotransferase [Candidatus Acidoferrales bacterium]
MSFVADRANIPTSTTLQVSDRVKELNRSGKEVVDLSAGEPDFPTPEHIREYAKRALDEGYTFYVDAAGLLDLREAIAEKLQAENGIHVNPKDNVIVTVGGKEAVFASIMATVNPGEEVIITDPGWVSYAPCVQLAGGRAVYLPLNERDEFVISPDNFLKAITNKTKMLILNSPNNPTGSVLSKEVLEHIADHARRKRILVLSDELYEKIIYDGTKHYSIGSFPGMEELAITVNGFSKSMAMTGWRLGYLAGPRTLVQRIKAIHSHMVTGPCTFVQRAAALALRDQRTSESINKMVLEYARRRELLVRELVKTEVISCKKPQGTFYAFANITRSGLSSEKFSKALLERARVAVIPGNAFGPHGEGFVRVSFAASTDNIGAAIERTLSAIPELKAPLP